MNEKERSLPSDEGPETAPRARWRWRSMLLLLAAVGLAVVGVNAHSSDNHRLAHKQANALGVRPPTDIYAYGANDGTVVVSWQPSHPAPVGYHIYRATGRHGPFTIVGSVNAPNMDTFSDNSNLATGLTYSYTVTAFDREGESRPAGPIVVLIVGHPPASPTIGPIAPLPTFPVIPAATVRALSRQSSAQPTRVSVPSVGSNGTSAGQPQITPVSTPLALATAQNTSIAPPPTAQR